MVSIRRLRAVLLFAVISAIGWAILGTILISIFRFTADMSITSAMLARVATAFAFFGFSAGTTWAVAIAMLPRKNENMITPLVAAVAGALGGVMVIGGMFFAMGEMPRNIPANLLVPLGMAGAIGGAVGLSIQRGAARGKLLVPVEEPRAIEP